MPPRKPGRPKKRFAYKTAKSVTRFQNRARMSRQMTSFGSSGKNRIGFPKTQLVKLRYCQSFQMGPSNTATIGAEYAFRANSIFDPDQSGAGHQPIGRDQWEPFYNTYTVVGSTINVRILKNPGAVNASSNSIVGVLLHDTATLPTTTVTTIQEQGLGSWRVLQGLQNGNVVNLKQNFSAKKFFNVTNLRDNQDRLGADMGSNPPSTGDAFYIIWAATTIAGGLSANSVEFMVTIEYSVLLSDPKALGQS